MRDGRREVDRKVDAEVVRLVESALSGAKQRAGWFRSRCPFCAERDQSFSYNPVTGYWHCFRCRENGFLHDVPEELIGAGPSEEEVAAELEEARRPPPSFTLLAEDDSETLAPAREYLLRRGVPERVWGPAQLGACYEGRYEERIVVPNVMLDGSWLGYTTRSYDPECPKKFAYRYPRGAWRGHVVWNEAALYADTDELLYVVEGVLKGLPYWPHAVAFLGNSGPSVVTDEQFAMLRSSRRPLVVVLDGDAHVQGWALAMRLRVAGCLAGAVRLPPKTDPDEVDAYELWEAARESLGRLADGV
jgi:hypothetical protein